MKIGVVGLGSIGKRHVTNLLEMGGHDIMGCDHRIGTDDWMSGLTIHAVSSVGAVWDWEPEAILICTPPSTHYALAIQAIRRKISVFIEKPIACTSEEADILRWEAKNFGTHLAVGYQMRFTDASTMARRLWDNDICIVSKQDMSTWPSQYQKDMLEEFSHEIDLAVYWNGPVRDVVAWREQRDVWKIDLIHVHSRCFIELNAAHTELVRYAEGGPGAWDFDPDQNTRAYKDELAAFLTVCRGGAWDERLCTGAEAAHVVRIIEAARESAANCKVVRL